ncbi:MAG: thiamine-phosphate pyrophosphorylase [Campylobacterales bacterium]
MKITDPLFPSLPLRTVDANLNRLREGIRVVEDLLRYHYNSPLALKFKELRHRVKVSNWEELVKARAVQKDLLRKSTPEEMDRKGVEEILVANLKRAQESARVLEELYKLGDLETAEKFKGIRYSLYQLEREVFLLVEELKKKGGWGKGNPESQLPTGQELKRRWRIKVTSK